MAMNGDTKNKPDSYPEGDSVPDNFPEDQQETGGQHENGDERRLHLRAFDYWHDLKGELAYPLFSNLSPAGLAPYKTNSLLLEFTPTGATVRFIGDKVAMLIEDPIRPGTKLEDFPQSGFAAALISQFETVAGREPAAEFEFVEDLLDCRGIMLPFGRTGDSADFMLVVVNFRRRAQVAHADSYALDDRVAACERAAGQVAHLDGGGRDSLYQALAAALALFEEAEASPDAYQGMLQEKGLKAQARAPFTPVLKLTFGMTYDKTRLTEYAAALSCARRGGQTSATLVAFLKAQPGGIKGCVKAERAARRGKAGSPAHQQFQMALKAARAAKAVALKSLKTDDEFCLVLARRGKDGGLEPLGLADVGAETLDAVLKRHHKK